MIARAELPVILDCHGARLLAVLHEAGPDAGRENNAGVLMIVGGPQYRAGSHRQFVMLARALATAGHPVMRFDYRGMGDSEGEVRAFDTIDDDIRAAIDTWYRLDPRLPGVVLWGLCDGASAAMIYCASDERVVGVVGVNPWVRTEILESRSYVKHYYGKRLLQWSFWAKVFAFRVDVRASAADFLRRLKRSNSVVGSIADGEITFIARMLDALERFRGPVLLQLSGRDLTAQQFVDLLDEHSGWRQLAAASRVRQNRLPVADHTFSNRDSLTEAAKALLAWLS